MEREGVFTDIIILSIMSDVIRHIGEDVKIGENVQIWNFADLGFRCSFKTTSYKK